METDAVAGDPMETDMVDGSVEEGSSDKDLMGGCPDSDDDSYSKSWNRRRSLFWYERPGSRGERYIQPSSYPWEEGGKGKRDEKEEMVKGIYILRVKDKSWPQLLDSNKNKEWRWDEHLRMRMVRSKITAASPCSGGLVDLCPETSEDDQPPCSAAKVVAVRLKMHKCFEDGVSYRRLFRSKANKEDLCLNVENKEPYSFYVERCQLNSTLAPSYAHVFPKLIDNPSIRAHWVKPTTFDGDKQYLEFFPMLMKVAEYGHTKDHVMAKAIVLANNMFQKMLFFQIDIAVQECMELLLEEETLTQRCNLYYFAVSEVVLNGKDIETVLQSIRAGETGLPYNLPEFASGMLEGVFQDMVHYLSTRIQEMQKCGLCEDWVFNEAHPEVANFIIEEVYEQLHRSRHYLYVDLITEKMGIAKDNGIIG